MKDGSRTIGFEQYRALARFRYELRRFLSFSEAAAAEAGLPAQQHQALLAIAGYDGPETPTVGYLSERLMIAPQTATELISRMCKANLVVKLQTLADRRKAGLALTEKAEDLLAGLTEAHLQELDSLEPMLARVLE